MGLAIVAASVLALLPVVSTEWVWKTVGSVVGGAVRRSSQETLVERGGLIVLAFLAIPVALAFAPVLVSRGRVGVVLAWTSAVLVLVLVVLTGFSIGLFYAPAAVALLAAAAVRGA